MNKPSSNKPGSLPKNGSSAKDDILARVRTALGGPSAPPTAYHSGIPRDYIRSGHLDPEQRIELFIDRLHDYEAAVHRTSSSAISATVATILESRGKQGLLVPPGIAEAWLPNNSRFVPDQNLPYELLDASEGVLTGCAAAIALTGSIILRHTEAEGRRALSLIPDYHLCVVFENQIVETVPEAIDLLSAFPLVPVTTIAGPSATADIEMTRIKGVHGPRTLEVILVGD